MCCFRRQNQPTIPNRYFLSRPSGKAVFVVTSVLVILRKAFYDAEDVDKLNICSAVGGRKTALRRRAGSGADYK